MIPDALSLAISLVSLYASILIGLFRLIRFNSFLAPFIISSANWNRLTIKIRNSNIDPLVMITHMNW